MMETAATAASPSLEQLANTALEAGRMLMEAGANARSVVTVVAMIARGLGAERVELQIGYASIAVTVGIGNSGITCMRKVGHLGVNQQLDQELWNLALRVSRGELGVAGAQAALETLARETPRHPLLWTALGVGLACAAFSRLLSVDWYGAGPVFLASALGQYTRAGLLRRGVNPFLCTGMVAFLCSLLGGIMAWWAGCASVTTAAVASVLLLVPGVPAVNAQSDILEGHPTLGSARAVSVAMALVFIAAGLWMSREVLILFHIV
jgi:uncharacterized membrane protein YjjP (DUF1212 family)